MQKRTPAIATLAALVVLAGCARDAASPERRAGQRRAGSTTTTLIASNDPVAATTTPSTAGLATVPVGPSRTPVNEAPPAVVLTAFGDSIPVFSTATSTEFDRNEPRFSLPAKNFYGSPTTLLVKARPNTRYEVYLPGRPNGATGFVRHQDIRRATTTMRVVVERRARRLTLFDGKASLATGAAAVGGGRTPTPIGVFFVTDVFTPKQPSPYGAAALAISAHVPGSDGADHEHQLGIYGSADQRSDTRGSIRVPDQLARELQRVPLGTPVEIRA